MRTLEESIVLTTYFSGERSPGLERAAAISGLLLDAVTGGRFFVNGCLFERSVAGGIFFGISLDAESVRGYNKHQTKGLVKIS